ncbi:hypothetical protein B0H14DRAFT_3866576 [Mycena olivaceomarginata]|nr:hypothetical protein B0H14DRAFT_3866576 [Mycena olivaceomarginata]
MIDHFSEYYFVLRECTSLTTASYALNAYDNRAVHAANQDLSLPCLTNLTIDAQNIGIVSCFLEKIALNSLTDLEIELHENSGDSAARFHSFPFLLRLEIHGEYCPDGSISAGDLDRLLGACPNIVEAWVDGEAKLQRAEAASHLKTVSPTRGSTDTLKAITPFRGRKSSSIQDVFQFHTTESLLFIRLMREYDIGIEYIDGLVVMDNKATPRLAIDPGDTR